MLGQQLTVFYGLDPQLLGDGEVLDILVALAGNIAGPAHRAFVEDIQEIIGIAYPVLQHRKAHGQSAAGGIGMKIMSGNTGTNLGITVVVYLGQRYPFAL